MQSPRFGVHLLLNLAVITLGSLGCDHRMQMLKLQSTFVVCCITCRAAHARRVYQCKFQAQWCVLSARWLPASTAARDGDAARQRWLGVSGAPLLQGTRRQAPVRYIYMLPSLSELSARPAPFRNPPMCVCTPAQRALAPPIDVLRRIGICRKGPNNHWRQTNTMPHRLHFQYSKV